MKERKLKLTIEKCNEFAKQYDFKVLDVYSENNKTKVTAQCKNGHIHDLNWSTFKTKHGCMECQRKYNREYIIEYAKQYNYQIKSFDDFHDLNTKLIFICPNGHELITNFANFMKGRRCSCQGGIKIYTPKEMKDYFEEQGCKLLSQYNTQKDIVDFQCNCGNIAKIRVDHFIGGIRCNQCAIERRRQTMYENGTAPCSTQQQYLYNLLGGQLNYPISNCSLDIAFPEEMLYIEYDGSGHNLQVKFGAINEDNFKKKEKRRYMFLQKLDWKCIRIISKNDFLPSDNKMLEMITIAKNYLNTKNKCYYVKFDIDNNKIIFKGKKYKFNYGELRKIKNNLEF